MSSPENVDNLPSPAISVIMSVYNGAAFIERAITSILNQTFFDFEFIILDDGSTDETPQIIKKFAAQDSRIVPLFGKKLGLTKALNKGALLAKGRYIARQDADDISYPQRLERQIDIMNKNPDLVLLGGTSDDIHESGLKALWPYHDDLSIQKILFLKTPFPHSTAMIRAITFRLEGGYDESFVTSQDMDLWMRLSAHGKVSMLKEPLIQRYVSRGSISTQKRFRQFWDGLRARMKHGKNPLLAFYHAMRSLIISLLPPRFVQNIKGYMT